MFEPFFLRLIHQLFPTAHVRKVFQLISTLNYFLTTFLILQKYFLIINSRYHLSLAESITVIRSQFQAVSL